MENHYFNINIATRYGVNCAIILQNICFWIEKNTESNQNLYDGKYWMYNPIKAFKEQFPYLTERQIRSALDTLKDEELVLTANYNKTCDRTLWYTVTQKALDIMKDNQDKPEIQEDFSNPNEEFSVESKDNLSESGLEEKKCQKEMTSESKGNDIQVNTYCHTSQNEMTSVSNGTNNKPQIINSDKLEKEIYKEKEPPDKVIFDFWNSKRLIKANELNNYLRTVITNLLKFFILDEVLLAIKRYDEIYNSKHYFDHPWSFKTFLNSDIIMKFLDNGEHWISYCNWRNKEIKQTGFIHNTYTSAQIASCISNLEELEV